MRAFFFVISDNTSRVTAIANRSGPILLISGSEASILLMKLLKVEISAENDDQARTILNPLLEAKLVTGGQIINSPARMLWKNEIISMKEYVMIHSYTIEEHKTAIIDSVRKTTAEEVPMITFNEIEVNDELQKWIMETVS